MASVFSAVDASGNPCHHHVTLGEALGRPCAEGGAVSQQTATIDFPSLAFMEALARSVNGNPNFRSLGTMDLALGIRILADGKHRQTHLYTFLFDGYTCEHVAEASAGAVPDLDFVIEGTYSAWKEMFQNIQANGRADTKHTLNHLTMLDDPMRAVGPDQTRIDKLYRYNYGIQSFLHEAAKIPTRYA